MNEADACLVEWDLAILPIKITTHMFRDLKGEQCVYVSTRKEAKQKCLLLLTLILKEKCYDVLINQG